MCKNYISDVQLDICHYKARFYKKNILFVVNNQLILTFKVYQIPFLDYTMTKYNTSIYDSIFKILIRQKYNITNLYNKMFIL